MWCVGPQALAEPVEAAAAGGADAADRHVECGRDVRVAVVRAEGEGAQQRPAAQREVVKGAAYEFAALVCLDDGLGGVGVVGRRRRRDRGRLRRPRGRRGAAAAATRCAPSWPASHRRQQARATGAATRRGAARRSARRPMRLRHPAGGRVRRARRDRSSDPRGSSKHPGRLLRPRAPGQRHRRRQRPPTSRRKRF